jgi:hypothetical protein
VSGLYAIVNLLKKNPKFEKLQIPARSLRSGLPYKMEGRLDLTDDPHAKCWGDGGARFTIFT